MKEEQESHHKLMLKEETEEKTLRRETQSSEETIMYYVLVQTEPLHHCRIHFLCFQQHFLGPHQVLFVRMLHVLATEILRHSVSSSVSGQHSRVSPGVPCSHENFYISICKELYYYKAAVLYCLGKHGYEQIS